MSISLSADAYPSAEAWIAPYPRAGGTWLPLGNPSPADRAQQPAMPVLQLVL